MEIIKEATCQDERAGGRRSLASHDFPGYLTSSRLNVTSAAVAREKQEALTYLVL